MELKVMDLKGRKYPDLKSACDAEDQGSIPGLGKFLWRRKWQPTPVFLPGQFHREAWWATVLGVTKSQTRLSN